MKKLVLIGDSIRLGYQDTVRRQLAGLCEIWTPAENGMHTTNLLLHFYDYIHLQQPDVLHLNAGGWDVRNVLWRSFGENIVQLDQYAINVRRLLELTRQHTNAKIIWATITPMNEEKNHATHAATHHPARRVSDIRLYNAAAVDICRAMGIEVNDLNAFVERIGAESIRDSDGVHFTPDGYRQLGEEVARVIKPHLV